MNRSRGVKVGREGESELSRVWVEASLSLVCEKRAGRTLQEV